jgi:hypothetical protein
MYVTTVERIVIVAFKLQSCYFQLDSFPATGEVDVE